MHRARVLAVLDDHRDLPVVSVEAPGGYGKTMALRQWAEHDGRPLIWITVRPQAPDATWLAHRLVDGLHVAGLAMEPAVLPSAVDAVAWHLGLLPVVERAVAEASHPFLLVIDEAGALHGPEWESLAASVAAHLPPGAQMVLASRTQAPASLRRMRATAAFVSVGPDVLALDATEGDELLRLLGLTLDQDSVLALLEQTGGWPIALPLAASALRAGRRRPGTSLVTTEALADYLRHEVLEPLDAEDRAFLLRCSVLPDLDQERCDAVSGTTGSVARMRRLAAGTRLLAQLDPDGDRFRMHPLLAAFLSEELRAGDPGAWRWAHLAAADAGGEQGDLDVAVFHLRAAGDDAVLAGVVWQHAGALLASGRTTELRRWLEGLDDVRLARSPRLALAAAWVGAHEGDMLRLEQMRSAARATATAADPDFVLDVGLLDATIGTEGIEAMRAECLGFLEARPVETPWHTLAHLLDGIGAFLLGHPDEARATLERGYRLTLAQQAPLITAHCLTALADLALQRGDRQAAIGATHEARSIVDRHRLDHIATSAPIFTTSAYVYLLEGRMAEARKEAARALRLTALIRSIAPWHAVQGRLALANVALGLGDWARARELLDEAAQGPDPQSPVLEEMRRQLRDQLDRVVQVNAPGSTLTTAEVRVLQYLPTHMSLPAIADELYVSRHTVKTQALAAYRKLGVHTRGEAIERARELGLLPPR